MTISYQSLLDNNRRWAAAQAAEDPAYFDRLTQVHAPQFLYIGCSDARVPANVITGTEAGDMFIHRNIANQVLQTDPNVLAVLQYAVEVLKVTDIIVCGHEGCGGVKAAMGDVPYQQVDAWLSPIRTVARLHHEELDALPDDAARYHRLVELNVLEQVQNLGRTQAVRSAWERGQPLRIHGWAYDLHDGLLRDLGTTIAGSDGAAMVAELDALERSGSGRESRAAKLRVSTRHASAAAAEPMAAGGPGH